MDNQYGQQNNPYQQGNPYTNNGYGNYGGPYNYGGNPEPQKAPNIFEQFVFSFIPPRYNRLTRVSTGSMIGFVTLLTLISTVISFISLAIDFASIDMKDWINELPNFEISDGHLYMEENFLYDEDDIFLYMTDDIDNFSYDDASELADEGYEDIVLIGRDGISAMQDGQYQQLNYSDMGDEITINRDWLVDTLAPIIMIVIVFCYLIFFVGRTLWYFLCAAVYLLFAMLIASIMKKQLPTGALFKTAVYAKVLMFVVATLLSVVPFVSLSVPFLLRVAVTIMFMGFAIAKLPE